MANSPEAGDRETLTDLSRLVDLLGLIVVVALLEASYSVYQAQHIRPKYHPMCPPRFQLRGLKHHRQIAARESPTAHPMLSRHVRQVVGYRMRSQESMRLEIK